MALRAHIFRLYGPLVLICLTATAAYTQTHVFARGGDGSLMHFDGAQWRSLGRQVVGSPDACSWGRDRIDVVVRGTNNHLLQIARVNGQWSGWYDLGGSLTSSPTCVSWGPNRIDLFARGADSTLVHKAFDGDGWSEWESLGGELAPGSSPDAASWGPNRIDVFVRGTDNALWQKAWTGTEWDEWVDLGGTLTSDPGAVSWGHNRISIFARRSDGQMMRKGWDGTQWSDWASYGGRFDEGSGPDVAAAGASHVELFARGMDGALWRRSWDGSHWTAWVKLGGAITSDPGAVIARAGRARFRVTLNGFTVNRQTQDHMLHVDGQHDEVYIAGVAWVIDNRGQVFSRQDFQSAVMGDINRPDWRSTRVRAGSASDLGGLKTGDTFPSRQPWTRSREPQRDRLPMLLWEGELIEGDNVAIIMPTIWEWDGDETLLRRWEQHFLPAYGPSLLRLPLTRILASTTPEIIGAGRPILERPVARTVAELSREAGDRPIGMTPLISNSVVSFTPKVLVITYLAAQEAVRTSTNDKGEGVFEILYDENGSDIGFPGKYTLYLHVEHLR